MGGRRGWLVLGLLLAAGATAAALVSDDARVLRVALLAMCWAFLIAAFLAGNRRADQVASAAREAELRHTYDLELEREVAARHRFEAELARRLRREAEEAVRAELVQLRIQLAGLAHLRTELAALPGIREELAGLGELRGDLGRMRTELTELLSGELLIERMVMRAQSVRGPHREEASPYELPSYEPPSHEPPSHESPSFEPPRYEPPAYEPAAYEIPAYEPPAYELPAESPGHVLLEQILSENGAPSTGERPRRRHHRDDDGGDDVLARVLGRS